MKRYALAFLLIPSILCAEVVVYHTGTGKLIRSVPGKLSNYSAEQIANLKENNADYAVKEFTGDEVLSSDLEFKKIENGSVVSKSQAEIDEIKVQRQITLIDSRIVKLKKQEIEYLEAAKEGVDVAASTASIRVKIDALKAEKAALQE